ncbi:MFS transporter [Martelella mediterranea]|uniref:Purine efflux pump PbuE n=1 Tax=Martelella mediterranea DSM 17316 TaxID=1122214 RepID=A0A1U9Z2Q3_9HYPH|nr:MFS transporter [Martelella mediterranea]AQZ51979.1 Purine efflux pump PbuE [Martelella mediterranea DSM 17316]
MPNPLTFRLRLAALVIGVFLIGANSFILSPILSDVAASLNTTAVPITWSISAFGGATGLSAFFLSRVIDRSDARLVFSAAFVVMALGFIGSAATPVWQGLAAGQALVGVATGILLPAIYSEAVRIAPEGQGARSLGIVLSGWSISLILGVPVSAALSDMLDWRTAYFALGGIAALQAVAFAMFRPSRPVEPGRAKGPARLQVLRIVGVRSLLVTCLCFMSAFYGTYALLGHHMRETLGISATAASMAALTYGVGFGIGGFVARQVDRLGPRRVFPYFLASSCLIYLMLIVATQTFWTSLLATLVLGFVNHFGLSLTVLLLAQSKPDARGMLIGLNITVTYIAVFCGPLLMSALYAADGFGAVSLMAAILVAVAVILNWRIRRI